MVVLHYSPWSKSYSYLEKQVKRTFFFLIYFSFFLLSFYGQPSSLSAPVWVYLETVPGNLSLEEMKNKTPPIQELHDISRFIVSGMLYGWKFSYTPPDNTRAVTEYFELSPIESIAIDDTSFTLSNISPEYPILVCWARYTLNEAQKRRLMYWNSIVFKNGGGIGRGERTDESQGIKNAYTNAIMQSVREYARSIEKNKPKEIRGEVKLKESPRLFSDQGYFVATVRVRINILEIIPYKVF